jgi:hypothetical protein
MTAGAPAAVFLGLPNREATQLWYDNITKQQAPHRCGGAPGGSDDAWFTKDGKRLGRYACFTDGDNLPTLVASNTESALVGAVFTAEPADSPYQLPKSEQELADWFTKKFT